MCVFDSNDNLKHIYFPQNWICIYVYLSLYMRVTSIGLTELQYSRGEEMITNYTNNWLVTIVTSATIKVEVAKGCGVQELDLICE